VAASPRPPVVECVPACCRKYEVDDQPDPEPDRPGGEPVQVQQRGHDHRVRERNRRDHGQDRRTPAVEDQHRADRTRAEGVPGTDPDRAHRRLDRPRPVRRGVAGCEYQEWSEYRRERYQREKHPPRHRPEAIIADHGRILPAELAQAHTPFRRSGRHNMKDPHNCPLWAVVRILVGGSGLAGGQRVAEGEHVGRVVLGLDAQQPVPVVGRPGGPSGQRIERGIVNRSLLRGRIMPIR